MGKVRKGGLPARAIIYCRVSTDDQAENGTSLVTQETMARKKAEEEGAVVVGVFRDEGVSGAWYTQREGVQRALAELEIGNADMLIAYDVSRLSRDVGHQNTILKRIQASGADLVFVKGAYHDSEEGQLMFTVEGGFAQYERQVIRRRSMQGKLRKVESGEQPARTTPPFGYHIPTKADIIRGEYLAALLGKYVIREDQAQWARQIFARYASGESLRGLCKWLVDQGVATPRGAAYWKPGTLRRILKNPAYKGMAAFGRNKWRTDESRLEKGFKTARVGTPTDPAECLYLPCEPLTDAETWEACQERLTTARKTHGGNPTRKHMLTGLLRCPKCGRSMVAHQRERTRRGKRVTSTQHIYRYHCPDAVPSANSGRVVCHKTMYDGHKAERAVMCAIMKALANPEIIQNAINAYGLQMASQTNIADVESEIATLVAEREALDAREHKTAEAQIDAMEKGRGVSVYDSIFREIASRRTTIDSRLAELRAIAGAPVEGFVPPTSLHDVMFGLLHATAETLMSPDVPASQKHDDLAIVVKDIVPDEEGGFRVNLKPFRCDQTVNAITMASPCPTSRKVTMSLPGPRHTRNQSQTFARTSAAASAVSHPRATRSRFTARPCRARARRTRA